MTHNDICSRKILLLFIPSFIFLLIILPEALALEGIVIDDNRDCIQSLLARIDLNSNGAIDNGDIVFV